jgi:SOS-response transcriptional repressor LexA
VFREFVKHFAKIFRIIFEVIVDFKVNQRIADIRHKKRLNKKEMADLMGIPSSIISDIENEKREPSKGFIHRFSQLYNISLNWLYYGVGPESLGDAVSEGKHPLITNIEALIKENMGDFSTRLSALEERLSATPEPESEYPEESGDKDSYTQDPEPEYVEVAYANTVAAGPPIGQSEDHSLVVDVPLRFIKTKPSDYYAVKVRGNSMIDSFIHDGSMVLIRKSDVPKDGRVQLVWIDGQATLKRLREREDHSWNLCYEDGTERTIPLGENNMIQGDFMAVLSPYTRPRMRGE